MTGPDEDVAAEGRPDGAPKTDTARREGPFRLVTRISDSSHKAIQAELERDPKFRKRNAWPT